MSRRNAPVEPRTATRKNASRVVIKEIASWDEFLDILRWPGFRNWCFRGQGQADWELVPSLTRQIQLAKICRDAWPEQEDRILRIFRRKCHLFVADTPGEKEELEWQALMQHHGAPTRLLDFTWSPYVAAFFALERASGASAVWALNAPLLHYIHEHHPFDGVPVRDRRARERKFFYEYYLPNQHAFVFLGDPVRMPQRVVAQSGTFLVVGQLGRTVESILQDYPGEGELLIKFVLPAGLRAEAMAELYSMNITQATLFPGLDGLARSMNYEFEYSWKVDLQTNQPRATFRDPQLPPDVLDGPTTTSGMPAQRSGNGTTAKRGRAASRPGPLSA